MTPDQIDPVTGRAILGSRAKRWPTTRGLIGVGLATGVVHLADLGAPNCMRTLCMRYIGELEPITATPARVCLVCARRRDEMGQR